MTRTVTDAAILLSAITGEDSLDEATKESAGKAHPDYTQFLNANALQGKRLGIDKTFLKGHEGVDALLQKALDQLRSKGATIVEIDMVSKFKELGDPEFQVLLYEFKADLNKYLSTANAKVKSLKDVIAFNKQHEAEVMPYFKQEIMEMAEAKGDLDSKEYQEAVRKNRTTARNNIDALLKDNNLDALIGPTTGPSWCTDLVNGDHFSGYDTSSPAAIAGYPHITVPMGLVFGLPIGLSFIGTAYNEGSLISLAYAYEQASKNRVAPKLGAGNKV
jgi:amidase